MISNVKKGKYPHPKARVYLSATLAVLSLVLALQLLKGLMLLPYFLSTFLITVGAYLLKIRFLLIRLAERPKRDLYQTEKGLTSWKKLMLVFGAVIALLFIPLILTKFIPPYAWFIAIVSFTSGISIAEILFYLRMR